MYGICGIVLGRIGYNIINCVCRLLTVVGSQDSPQQTLDVDHRRPATTPPSLYGRFKKKFKNNSVFRLYIILTRYNNELYCGGLIMSETKICMTAAISKAAG